MLQHIRLSRVNRIYRAVWRIFGVPFFRCSPVIFFSFRRVILSIFGAKLTSTSYVYPDVEIWSPANLQMGRNSVLAPKCYVYNVHPIILGDNVTVSQFSKLITASHDYGSLDLPLVAARIELREFSWVTANVTIGPGVVIGEGAVVLTGSVVVKDLMDWRVYGGNPARFIKMRIIK